jgi:hypothetical protein
MCPRNSVNKSAAVLVKGSQNSYDKAESTKKKSSMPIIVIFICSNIINNFGMSSERRILRTWRPAQTIGPGLLRCNYLPVDMDLFNGK